MSEKRYCQCCGQPISGYSQDYIEKADQPKAESNLIKLAKAIGKGIYAFFEWGSRPPKHNSNKNK